MEKEQQSSFSTRADEANSHQQRKYWKYPQFIILFICSILIILAAITQKPAAYLEKEPVIFNNNNLKEFLPIYSGDIHYARFPKQYWEHRILMMKAMGLNSLGIYVMWNYHEIEKGKFDFQTGNRDLAGFLELARKHEMNVLLRPGPYICGEWDFGGIPARLLGVKGLQIRTNNKLYENEVKLYFQAIAPIIRPYLHINGGNIILLQIQNELGSYSTNSQYIQDLISIWKDLDIECEYYLQDGFEFWKKDYTSGTHIALSGGDKLSYYTDVMKSPIFSRNYLVFGGEIYTGWLTHWGEVWNGRETDEYMQQITRLVKNGRSINLFMAYGGTNFGLTAGANGFPNHDYMPHITSYDYDAPINEQGRVTPKYMATRRLFQQVVGYLPEIPAPVKTIQIAPFKLQTVANLFANLPAPALINSDLTFFESDLLKMYDQGIVIYETVLPGKQQDYEFNVTVRDYALFFIDDVQVATINRQKMANYSISLSCNKPSCVLKVLVEAMGHINYGAAQLNDRKGLIELRQQGKTIQESVQFKWTMTKVPINNDLLKMTKKDSKLPFPSLMRSQFKLTQVGDTFFDMTAYKKGYLWINGHLLGRYWDAGPQKRLYCPGTWLKAGKNTVEVLQLLTDIPELLAGFETQY